MRSCRAACQYSSYRRIDRGGSIPLQGSSMAPCKSDGEPDSESKASFSNQVKYCHYSVLTLMASLVHWAGVGSGDLRSICSSSDSQPDLVSIHRGHLHPRPSKPGAPGASASAHACIHSTILLSQCHYPSTCSNMLEEPPFTKAPAQLSRLCPDEIQFCPTVPAVSGITP